MNKSGILVRDLAQEWLEDSVFRAEYDALEDEFALAAASIEAHDRAELTEADVAAPGTRLRIRPEAETGAP